MSEKPIMKIKTTKADGVRCPRCFRFTWSCNHDNLCNRCVAILCKHFKNMNVTIRIVAQLAESGRKPSDNPEWENV